MAIKSQSYTFKKLGWGVRPKSLNGYIHYIVFAIITAIALSLPVKLYVKLLLSAIILGVFISQTSMAVKEITKGFVESAKHKQLVIERSVSFAAMLTILTTIIYQLFTRQNESVPFDLSLIIVAAAMLIAKSVSYTKVKKRA